LPSVSPAGTWPSAEAFPMSAINPIQFLDAIGGAVAESLGRRDGVWGQGRQAA
jgi:hypothetical protein